MNIILEYNRKIKKFFNVGYYVRTAERKLEYVIRHDTLVHEALNCTRPGVSEEAYCDHDIIVSLTTYGKRLYDVAPVIESIMQGSMKPNRIVLNLDDGMKGKTLPIAVQNQQKRGLEVMYCKDIKSYKKLIPTLKKYPEAAIITIDDDILYFYDLVERTVNAHIASPEHIIANRIHRIKLGEDGRPIGYMNWEWCANPSDDSPLNFFTSGGGTLFPPHCFPDEVFDEDVFMQISPTADDVWFNAMSHLQGTRTKKCLTHTTQGDDFLINEDVQETGLSMVNTGRRGVRCGNDKQLEAVFNKYNLWGKLNDNATNTFK